MKCPKCATSQTRREGTACKSCKYQYVFDPKSDGITDTKFMALLSGASAKDTYYFTFNQLYARYCRGREQRILAVFETLLTLGGRSGRLAVLGGVVGVVVGRVLDSTALVLVSALVILVGVVAWIAGRFQRQISPEGRAAASREALRGWVNKWRAAERPIERLLEKPSLDRAPGPYRESDIYDYGVERILVVQHDLLVDLFVKNNFHADQRALVLSENGYPSYLLSHAKRLLQERADLPVLLLHDATPTGTRMRERLIASGLLPLSGRQLIDAGLFPKDVPKIKALGPTVPEATAFAVPVDLIAFGALAGGLAGLALAPPPVPESVEHPQPPQRPAEPGSTGSDGGGASSDSSFESSHDSSGDDGAAHGGADFGGSADFGGDADFG